MKRRIPRSATSRPPVNDTSHNNAIFHVRTHHNRELAKLSKGTKETTNGTPGQAFNSQNESYNNHGRPAGGFGFNRAGGFGSSMAGGFGSNMAGLFGPNINAAPAMGTGRRRARREFTSGTYHAPSQLSSALVPALTQLAGAEVDDSGGTGRFKFRVSEVGGERPTKIVATLGNNASLNRPEGVVRLTRNSFHTPTIREIGSSEDLCQLSNNDRGTGGSRRPAGGFPNLWGEDFLGDARPMMNGSVRQMNQHKRSRSPWQTMDAPTHQPNHQEHATDSWRYADGSTYRQKLAGHENHPWQYEDSLAHTPNERLPEFQGRGQRTDVQYAMHCQSAHPQQKSSHRRHSKRSSKERKVEHARRRNPVEPDMGMRAQQPRVDTHAHTGVRPHSAQDDTTSSSNSEPKSEEFIPKINQSGSNLYGSCYHDDDNDDDKPPQKPLQGASILKTPTGSSVARNPPNTQPLSSNNNFYPTTQTPYSRPQFPPRFGQRCITCTYGPCSTCRVPLCVVCGAVQCTSCTAPVCLACSAASCSVYNSPVCISCCSLSPQAPAHGPQYPAYPYPAPTYIPPPCDIPNPTLPCDPYAVHSNPALSPCSPYIDWAARCNLPPLIPNYVCETGPRPEQCNTTAPLDNLRSSARPNKFLDLISRRQLDPAADCQSCRRLQVYAGANGDITCPRRLVRCALHRINAYPTASYSDDELLEEEEEEELGAFRTFFNVVWVVVPVIIFYMFTFVALSRLIAVNKFARLAAVMANTTLLYIIALEPDDLIVYPTDRPQVKEAPPSCPPQCPPPCPPQCPPPCQPLPPCPPARCMRPSNSHLSLCDLPRRWPCPDSHSAPL